MGYKFWLSFETERVYKTRIFESHPDNRKEHHHVEQRLDNKKCKLSQNTFLSYLRSWVPVIIVIKSPFTFFLSFVHHHDNARKNNHFLL